MDKLEELRLVQRQSLEVIKKLNDKVSRLKKQLNKQSEPVAVIGMSCRFPGASDRPEALWNLLASGGDGIEPIPQERWSIEDWYNEDPDVPGKTYLKEGGFLSDLESFDASFFKVSPQEARSFDPQQRLLLECCCEALEHAGLSQSDLSNTNTGVYVGISGNEYVQRTTSDADQIDAYSLIGTTHCTIAGRISYWLGLTGPNLPVDTACSSSLVSLHLAIQAMRNGDCDQAIVGGVNVLLDPEGTVFFSKIGSLSPNGRCHTFSNKADGFVRSEGAGVLVLKPLSKAQADGDNILALIKGTAINQDGKSQGFTAPNGPSQQQVIKKALQQAQLQPSDIDYIECHGTGTDLGDPIEVQSIGEVFKQNTSPVVLGSIKSNIGHTEAAAGVAGVIKTILSLQNNLIPKSLHCEELNEKIDWDHYQVKVAQEAIPWERSDRPRRAGVSSFGISGTNAHVILEEAPQATSQTTKEETLPPRSYQLISISGEGSEALSAQSEHLSEHLNSHPDQSLEQIAYSLATTRSHFRTRNALVSKDRKELIMKLSEPIDTTSSLPGKLAFLYTGGGAQYIGMGKELYETEPVFTKALDECLTRIQRETGEDFKEILFTKEGSKSSKQLDEIDYMLLALFAIEYSLTRLWQSWGIEPDILMGHSLGEIVAATVAGVFSLSDGIKLVAARGKLMASVKQAGKMATIEASQKELKPFLEQANEVSIAGENGPRQTLISGALVGIEEITKLLEEAGIKVKVLPISQGSHSPLMEEILPAFRQVAEQIDYRTPDYPLISNVSGKLAGEDIQTADYWTRHIRETVLFSSGMQALEAEGVTTYLEIGPRPSLISMGAYCVSNSEDCQWLASINQESSDTQMMLESLGSLYRTGINPDWDSFYHDREQEKITLPTYAFQRKRYWIDSKRNQTGGRSTGHPLLGSELEIAGQKVYEQELSIKEIPYLADHQVMGGVIVPGAALAELVQGFIHLQEDDYELTELLIAQPLILPEEGSVRLQLITENTQEGYDFKIHSRSKEGNWQVYGSGSVSEKALHSLSSIDREGIKTGLSWKDIGSLYDDFENLGISYGPAFQGIKEVYADDKRAFGKIILPATDQSEGYHTHPTLLESIFQLRGAIGERVAGKDIYLPFEVRGFYLRDSQALNTVWAELEVLASVKDKQSYTIRFWDERGDSLGAIAGLEVRQTDIAVPFQKGLSQYKDWLHITEWDSIELKQGVLKSGSWILSANQDSDLALSLSEELSKQLVHVHNQEHKEGIGKGSLGLISIWESEEEPQDLPLATEQLSSTALSQLQAAIAAGVEEVVWITRNVHNTSGNINLTQAPLWGLLRVAMNEYPDIRFRLIDLDSEVSAHQLHHLICSQSEEEQFRIRGQEITGLRLKRFNQVSSEEELSIDQGTVLITGGLGALGLKVAGHLVTQHKTPHLVLLGRSQPKEAVKKQIEYLESQGTKITIASCDVSDRDSLAKILNAIPEKYPLKGIVHAAGVLDDGIITEQNQERLRTTMLSKVYGGWYLHDLTREQNLDLFLVFSSMSNWLGSSGQSNYAAANLFLDQLISYRRAQELVGHAINWGPVSDVGLAAEATIEEIRIKEQGGVSYLTSEEGVGLLDTITNSHQPQVGIIPIRKNQLGRALMQNRGRVPHFYQEVAVAGKQQNEERLAVYLRSLERGQRLEYLENYLRNLIADVLGTDSQKVPLSEPLQNVGVNSLKALELRNSFSRQLGLRLPATLLYDYPTIEELSGYLSDRFSDDIRTRKAIDWQALTAEFLQEEAGNSEKSKEIIQTINHLKDLLEENVKTGDDQTNELTDDDILSLSDNEISEGLDQIFEEELD